MEREQPLVEVRVLYGDTVLDVRHLGGSARYTIGESHDADWVVSPGGLPDAAAFVLVQGRTLRFTEAMRGVAESDDARRSLGALVAQGNADRDGSVHAYAMRAGERCVVEHSGLRFEVRRVTPAAPLRLDAQCSRPLRTWTALACLLFVSLLIPGATAALRRTEPPASSLALDPPAPRVAAFSIPAQPPSPAGLVIEGAGGGIGRGFGRGVPRQGGVLGCLRRDLLAIEAEREGGPVSVASQDPCEMLEIGGISQMARNFEPDLFASSAAVLLHEHPRAMLRHEAPAAPRMRVRGPIDAELVRRIVAAHRDEIRRCHAKRPGLRGRLVVQFSISARGRVIGSRISDSSLRDRALQRCMLAAVRGWTFPRPGGGPVRVSVPLVLDRDPRGG